MRKSNRDCVAEVTISTSQNISSSQLYTIYDQKIYFKYNEAKIVKDCTGH